MKDVMWRENDTKQRSFTIFKCIRNCTSRVGILCIGIQYAPLTQMWPHYERSAPYTQSIRKFSMHTKSSPFPYYYYYY